MRYPLILIYLFISISLIAQTKRVVISTEKIRHSLNDPQFYNIKPSNDLEKKLEYLDSDTIPFSGILIQFFNKDTLFVKTYENGQLNGVSIDFEVGKGYRTHVSNYKNGKMDGEQISYFPVRREDDDSSKIILNIGSKTKYKYGIQDGIQYEFFENGKIRKEETYVDGIKKGIVIIYNEDGSISEKSEF